MCMSSVTFRTRTRCTFKWRKCAEQGKHDLDFLPLSVALRGFHTIFIIQKSMLCCRWSIKDLWCITPSLHCRAISSDPLLKWLFKQKYLEAFCCSYTDKAHLLEWHKVYWFVLITQLVVKGKDSTLNVERSSIPDYSRLTQATQLLSSSFWKDCHALYTPTYSTSRFLSLTESSLFISIPTPKIIHSFLLSLHSITSYSH